MKETGLNGYVHDIPATSSCVNVRYLENVINGSVITYDKITEETKCNKMYKIPTKCTSTKTVLTNSTSTNFYILLAFY